METYILNGRDDAGKTYEGKLKIYPDGTIEGKIHALPAGLEKHIYGRLSFNCDEKKLVLSFEERFDKNVVCKDIDRIIFTLEKETMASSLKELVPHEFLGEYIGMFSEIDEDIKDINKEPNVGKFYLTVLPSKEEESLENKLDPYVAFEIASEAVEEARQLEKQKKENIVIMFIPLDD